MPGIYAFQAPSDSGARPDRDIQLYYNTARQNLALTLKASSGSGQDTRISYIAQENNQKGVVVDKTQLDSTIHNGVRLIVGLTFPELESGTTEYTNYDVSIISPMYMPLAKSSTHSKAVALCSDGEEAWVFYITGDDDNSRALSYTTVLGESESEIIPDIPRILNGTALVAIYDSYKKESLVYYQGKSTSNYIYEYSQNSGAATPIKSTNNALQGTPISLSLDVAGGILYMYYTDGARKVNRISRVIKDPRADWSPSMEVQVVRDAVSPSSQLGVAAVANKKQNHIFFVPENSKGLKFIHYVDPWLA
jgi:hypothetical protein